jgi:L-rhamnose mutarotase
MSKVVFVLGGMIAGAGLCRIVTKFQCERRRRLLRRSKAPSKRFGGAIRLRPEMYHRYTQLHDAVWDEVLERMHKSNIRNFVIYYHGETSTLFSHFEYIGHWDCASDQEAEQKFVDDMKAIASDPIVGEWWRYCEPCQEPFSQWPQGHHPPSQGGEGEWWAPLECLCHCGHWPIEYDEYSRRDPSFVFNNPNGLTSSRLKPPVV